MRKVLERSVDSAEQLSQAMQQFGCVRPDLRQYPARQKAEQPDKVFVSVQSNFRERLALPGQLHPWQHDFRRAVRQVLQSLALQLKEAALAARVHDFQNERAAAGR